MITESTCLVLCFLSWAVGISWGRALERHDAKQAAERIARTDHTHAKK